MNGIVLVVIVLGIFTLFWMKGWINVGGVMSLYRKIRLAALLWAAVILAIGLVRIISGEGF